MMLEKVRVVDTEKADWMQSFAMPLPDLKDIGKTANLPMIADRSFARTAIAAQDTYEGSVRLFKDGVEASLLERDPRLEQIRRMSNAKTSVFVVDEKTRTLSLAPPPKGTVLDGPDVMGVKMAPAASEASAPALAQVLTKEMASRAQALPQHLRGRMKALETVFAKVREERKAGRLTDRQAFSSMADIAERAFLVGEGGKTDAVRQHERRMGKVDTLFGVSAHAARATARLDAAEAFDRGLVSDVVASNQRKRVEGVRGLRDGDDFLGTTQRLSRLGLVAETDPRLRIQQPALVALAKEPEPQQDAFAQMSMQKTLEAKPERTLDVAIKHPKPPEHTAPTSVAQVGVSGSYLAQEFGRDNDNAHFDREREAKARKQFDDAEAKKARFASAGTLEAVALARHKQGVKDVGFGLTAAGMRANNGIQDVSRALERPPVQKQPQQKSQMVR